MNTDTKEKNLEVTCNLIHAINNNDLTQAHLYIEKYRDELAWKVIASNAFFDYKFFKKYLKYLQTYTYWISVKTLSNFSEKELSDLVNNYKNINWNAISFCKIKDNFIVKYIDKLDTNILITNGSISFKLLLKIHDKVDILTWIVFNTVSYDEICTLIKKTKLFDKTIQDKIKIISCLKIEGRSQKHQVAKLLNISEIYFYVNKNRTTKYNINEALEILNKVNVSSLIHEEKLDFLKMVYLKNIEIDKKELSEKLEIDPMYIDIMRTQQEQEEVKAQSTNQPNITDMISDMKHIKEVFKPFAPKPTKKQSENVDDLLSKMHVIRNKYDLKNSDLDLFLVDVKNELLDYYEKKRGF